MKAEARVLDVQSTLQGERVGMTIDEGALAHIMAVLTDLYSDPEMAIIREISTNALDAHVEAGIKRPIEVTTPTALAPFFTIRDFGTGLNIVDIREIYSRYGASTKRESNEVVGMLGLGCKSPLTYTDQFTLTGIKDGIMTQVSVSRDEDGSGSMTIVAQEPTNLPSGVEVIVPVKRHNNFEQKCRDFFRFWEPGTVLVNQKQPERISGTWIADDLLLTNETDASYVVMGNVPYPMLEDVTIGQSQYINYRFTRTHTVAFVPIGEVTFTPSRESLQATSKTKATLARIRDRVQKESQIAFAKMIDEAPDKHAALKKYHEVLIHGYASKQPTYKGQPIPLEFLPVEVPAGPTDKKLDWQGNKIIYREKMLFAEGVKRYRRRGGNGEIKSAPNDEKHIWLVGFTGAELTPYKRMKLDQWREKNNVAVPEEGYIIVNSVPSGVREWISPDKIIEWSVIEAEKIIREKVKRQDGRPSGSYSGFVSGTHQSAILAADIDTNKPLFYRRGSSNVWTVSNDHSIKAINSLHQDCTVIVLGENRIAKFKRDFPNAKEVNSYLRDEAIKWQKNLTEDDKLSLWFNDNSATRTHLSRLDASLVNDPDLVKAIQEAQNKSHKVVNEYQRWRQWGASYDYRYKSPLDRYPLLTSLSTYGSLSATTKKHVHIYINAAFAAESEA